MTACEVTRSLQLVGVPKSLFPSLGRTQRQHFASLLLLVGDVPESTLSGTQRKGIWQAPTVVQPDWQARVPGTARYGMVQLVTGLLE